MTKKVITIDGSINLAEVVRSAGLHRLSIVDELTSRNIARSDAEAFADFAIARAASSGAAEDQLSDEQYARLTYSGTWSRDAGLAM